MTQEKTTQFDISHKGSGSVIDPSVPEGDKSAFKTICGFTLGFDKKANFTKFLIEIDPANIETLIKSKKNKRGNYSISGIVNNYDPEVEEEVREFRNKLLAEKSKEE